MDLTTWTAQYVVDYRKRELDEEIRERTKRHILDSLIAVASGAVLRPGKLAQEFVGTRKAAGRATVAGSGLLTSPELAALSNGMCAHSDETDDLNDLAQVHSGAAIVPAALASAEHSGATGEQMLRAVCAGYDVAVGINISAWEPGVRIRKSVQASNATGQVFGSATAAAVISDLSVAEIRQVLSYATQMVGGINSFHRDPDHIEKAFVMGGQHAYSGVMSVEFMKAGFTGVSDIFDGKPSLFEAWGDGGDRTRLRENIDRRHVMNTDMKQFPVGGPILAAAQAMKEILEQAPLRVDEVESIEARLPSVKAWIVDDRDMPNIHLQYCLAVMVADGELTFANSHNAERHRSPEMREVINRVTLIGDKDLDPPPSGEHSTRRSVVKVVTTDGRTYESRVDAVRGSAANPFDWNDLENKANSVLSSVLPSSRIEKLVQSVRGLELVDELSAISELLVTNAAG